MPPFQSMSVPRSLLAARRLLGASGRHLACIYSQAFFLKLALPQARVHVKRLARLFRLLVAVPSRGISRSSLPRSGLPLAPLHSRAMGALRGAMQPPRVRTLVLPLPAPIPLRSWLDFGRRIPWHRHPIGPGLHRASHLRSVQRASGFFPTRPHGAWPDCLAPPPPACSRLWLAVASNLLRRGLGWPRRYA